MNTRSCKAAGRFLQPCQVLQHEKPFVVHRNQLVLGLVELGHFKIDIGKFVVEHMLIFYVHQLHLVVEAVLLVFVTRENEIQNADGIDIIQMKIPVASPVLLDNREGGIEHATVFEEVLTGLLHFHDELLAVLALAVDIEDGTALAK